jgi:hypothetical protein
MWGREVCRYLLPFRRNVFSPFVCSNSEIHCLRLTLRNWSYEKWCPPKRRYVSTRLHGLTYQVGSILTFLTFTRNNPSLHFLTSPGFPQSLPQQTVTAQWLYHDGLLPCPFPVRICCRLTVWVAYNIRCVVFRGTGLLRALGFRRVFVVYLTALSVSSGHTVSDGLPIANNAFPSHREWRTDDVINSLRPGDNLYVRLSTGT